MLVSVDRVFARARDRGWDDAADTLCGIEPTHITVDVFDTVLTRRVVSDRALWWVTAAALRHEGCWATSPEEFVDARAAAAESMPGADMHALYRHPALRAGLRCDGGPAVESRTEAELTVAVPGAAAALRRLRSAGHRITFVSDMHLGQGEVWDSLVRHDVAVSEDHLVISSAVGASKASGTLFPVLTEGQDAPSWHVGNDLWSDVAMAERAGVCALPVRLAESSELEKLMAHVSGSVGSAVAGAARLVRTASGARSDDEACLVEAGADVAGQCLSAFLLWVREQCELAEITQVMFLARDGELPLAMARAMPADHWDGFQLEYLHGSRWLWSVAAAAVIGMDEWVSSGCSDEQGFLRQKQHEIPWGSLLARAALEPDDLDGHPLLRDLDPDEPLPPQLDWAWPALLASAEIRERLADRATRQLEDLHKILESTGIAGARVAIVDVGWRGQLASHMSAVLRPLTGHEPVHLHFGGVDVDTNVGDVDIRRFAVDDLQAPLPFPDIISCVETFTASGGARVRATQRDTCGRVTFMFDPPLAPMQTEERRLLWRSAIDVATQMPSRNELTRWGLHGDARAEGVREVLLAFWTSPSARHARAGAQLASEIDDTGTAVRPVASTYGLADLTGGTGTARTWRQGSLRLTRQPLRSAATTALRIKDARVTIQRDG